MNDDNKPPILGGLAHDGRDEIRAKMLAQAKADPSPKAWHYLSFADGSRPKGTQFLGACIIEAPNIILCAIRAYELGINPGGEILSVRCESVPPEKWRNRLLTREDIAAMDATFPEGWVSQ